MAQMTLFLRDYAGLDGARPVTGGVPIAEGSAPAGTAFALRDGGGQPVPVQATPLARWKDGSTRWALLDLVGAAPADGQAEYTLSWGEEAAPAAPQAPVRASGDAALVAGETSLRADEEALLRIGEALRVDMTLIDEHGERLRASVDRAEVEAAGPLRGTLQLHGAFVRPSGERWFTMRLRASVYAGSTMVRLEPLIIVDADEGILQRIRELALTITPSVPSAEARLGGDAPHTAPAGSSMRLFQVDDERYVIEGSADGAATGGKAPGWAELDTGDGRVAVALREFWQQWPKSLEVRPDGLAIGLLPRFAEGAFAHVEPWHKYQYLFDGDCYQLRTGQARRWEIWLDTAGDGTALARHADAPLVPAADPAAAIDTGVWDEIFPAGSPEMAEYDVWAENLFHAYTHAIEVQRDYGAMNWGDWYGERQVNWGNHEYDTTNQVLIQYARTADPRYLYVADAAAHHSAAVDTIHHVNRDLDEYFQTNWPHPTYPSRPGMVHEHAVGHVGTFYPIETVRDLFVEHGIVGYQNKSPYLCLDPHNLGHIWTQGLVRQYFLTGDPFLRETVEKIGDNLATLVEDREFQFMGTTHCGRVTGWPLLALGGAYELGLDDRYLQAMRTLTEDALRDQDPVCGGWLIYPMAWDHCTCKTARHTGMAGFITAILINGISRYYALSGDERLPSAIDRAVTFLDNDTWREENTDWRYTSCPASKPRMDQPGVVIMAHVNSIRFSDNPEHLRVLRVAW
ncbi:MAG: hypothetical protein GX649_06265, partial [Chloroflexi bacterium]|nr:hypothetical protein [Chloroflexota bacterium]